MMTDRKTYGEQLFGSAAAGQTLTEGEELLAAFLRSSNVGAGILDSNVRYLAVNKVLAEMSGVPAQDHLGRTVREVLGEIGELIEHKFSQVLATRQGLKFEVSGKAPSRGENRHWIIDMFPIPSRQDSVTRIGAIVYELTTPTQLEQSLQQLDGQLRRETKRLRMLTDVISLLSANWDIAQLFPRISARLRRVLHQEFASFALHDTATGLLVHHATDFPLGKELTSAVPVSTSETPAWRSMQERKPMIFSKEQLQGFNDEVARGLLAEGLQSLCCAPLLRPKGPLGVFVLGSTRPDAFREEDLELINQVATQLAVEIENRRTAVEIEQLKQRLGEERSYLEGESRAEGQFPEIVGESVSLKQVLEQVAIVAVSEATVLILGETGTGKEPVAHAIHRMSRLKTGPFIKVNCAAIPTGLLESELFGHEKGAFTGAVSRKIGRIELADGGTLFLDEVGEISAELQPKLLRVLQDQEAHGR
jgi:PAS domain S-box-containing protein